jgi:hypothetical protein
VFFVSVYLATYTDETDAIADCLRVAMFRHPCKRWKMLGSYRVGDGLMIELEGMEYENASARIH